MDIYEYAEKMLGRKLTILERRVIRSVHLHRHKNPEWKPEKASIGWSAADLARYKTLSPIVDQYLQVNANA